MQGQIYYSKISNKKEMRLNKMDLIFMKSYNFKGIKIFL